MANNTEIGREPETGEESSQLQPLSIVRMIWKRRRLALLLWVLGTAAAILIVHALPSVYQAEAVVLVNSQKIPVDFVSPTVRGDVPDRLALITQSIMTTARLLNIIDTFHLYEKERRHLTQEELLRKVRADISVNFEKSWTGDRMHAFQLSYQGKDAKTVAEVTNRLASLYVAENARAREHQAENTVDFLRRQLQEAKASLDEQEARVARFKEEHNGSLPEQQSSLLGTLSSLSVQLQGIQQSLEQAQENKSLLESSLSAAESAEATVRANLRLSNGPDGVPKLKSDILKAQLRELRSRYTADYPDVIVVERQLAQAEREESAGRAALGAGPDAADHKKDGATGEPFKVIPPELVQARERVATLRAQVGAAKHQIESLEKEREQTLRAIADCKDRINKLPLVEQEMASLKRNYEESETNYNSLLQKQLAAGVANDMERSQQSEQFTIVEPARVPEKPVKPNRPLLAAAGSVASLLLALGLGFALEFRKRTLLGEWELPPGILVLGRVPVIDMARYNLESEQA
ncbi:MAG TPA: Wzz/FepE/Etk N-terminal domain-containing protein [Bryobacteraceae bacterium]|jgi:polysaccharide chain length determinant protein (PEP-CTERM system associated)|nr:Wzz/FepE/Etk N-terminal domain-containing protein [Bryobacteraceae bacterium]